MTDTWREAERMCGVDAPEEILHHHSRWICSLEEGHLGDHEAHPGHNIDNKPSYVWPGPNPVVTPEELEEVFRSIQAAAQNLR